MGKQKRTDDDDEDIGEFGDTFHVSVVESEEGPKIFNVFIFKGIESAEQFIPAIEALQIAQEEDLVMVHLSTPGGSVNATDTFLLALKMCRARIVFVASGGVHSAGTLILMHADEVILSDGFNALVHNGSVGHGGKFNEYAAASAHAQAFMCDLFRKTYKGFLDKDEIERMIEGKDYWFNADEFNARLKNRIKERD